MNAPDDKVNHSRDEGCFREENAFFNLLITVNVDLQRKSLQRGILRQRISRDISVPPGAKSMAYLIYVRFSSRYASNNSLDEPRNFRHHINSIEPLTQVSTQLGFHRFIIFGLSIPEKFDCAWFGPLIIRVVFDFRMLCNVVRACAYYFPIAYNPANIHNSRAIGRRGYVLHHDGGISG